MTVSWGLCRSVARRGARRAWAHPRRQRDCEAYASDAFGLPALREADDEQSCVTGGIEDALLAGADEHGLRHDPDHLLDEQRGAGEKRAMALELGVTYRAGIVNGEPRIVYY